MATYRPNVAIILRKPKNGKIFVAERSDHRGSWGFPQGGVDKGEDLLAALRREVQEEIGIPPELYTIVEIRTGYRYKFPGGRLKKGIWLGQEQTYFLCDYHGKKEHFNLEAEKVQEFVDFKWVKPENFRLSWVPHFKRPIFRRLLKDFFGVRARLRSAKKTSR